MPNIALCISGQPRSYEKGYEYIKENLLAHHDIDVFYHTWYNKKTDFAKIKSLYNPVDFLIDQPLKNLYNTKYTRIPSEKFPAYFTVSAFYSIFKANKLKKLYERKNKFIYDWVIRIRFDFALNVTINFSILDKSKLYIPNCRLSPFKDYGNDQFALGSSYVIDRYSSTFLFLDKFYNKNKTIMIGEDMLRDNLILHSLVGDKLVYVDMNNPFPPGDYNSTWHSLIRDDYASWSPNK
jgi:hypothetical protein